MSASSRRDTVGVVGVLSDPDGTQFGIWDTNVNWRKGSVCLYINGEAGYLYRSSIENNRGYVPSVHKDKWEVYAGSVGAVYPILPTSSGIITTSDDTHIPTIGAVGRALDYKVDKNPPVVAATKTKITYDTKGLVISGSDLSVSDIPDLSSTSWFSAATVSITSSLISSIAGKHGDHIGDVISVGLQTQINPNTINNIKLADMPANTIKLRRASDGDPEDVSLSQFLSWAGISAISGTVPYVHPNHTGDVSSVSDGTTLITANSVNNAKLADMVGGTIKGRPSGISGDPTDLSASQVLSVLNLSSFLNISAVSASTKPGDNVTVPTTALMYSAINSSIAVSTNNVYVKNSEVDHLAITPVVEGDVVVRTDLSKTFVNKAGLNTSMSDWQELLVPTSFVPLTRMVTAGNGLVGGGNLNSDISLAADYGTSNPLMNGTVSVGSSLTLSRADHIHPSDTTKAESSHNHFLSTLTEKSYTSLTDKPDLTSLHSAITLGNANGLGLSGQQLSLSIATSASAGACPQLPASGGDTKFLNGLGSFATVTIPAYALVDESANGLMKQQPADAGMFFCGLASKGWTKELTKPYFSGYYEEKIIGKGNISGVVGITITDGLNYTMTLTGNTTLNIITTGLTSGTLQHLVFRVALGATAYTLGFQVNGVAKTTDVFTLKTSGVVELMVRSWDNWSTVETTRTR